TGTCTDQAGNSASATVASINIDETAPTISGSPDRAANANGWYNADVTVSFSCADSLSGLAGSPPAATTLSTEAAGQSATGTCTDKADNSASATVASINIDKTAPALNISGAASGTSNVCSGAPSRPTFAPSDALSGLDGSQGDSWTPSTTPSGVGTYTYSAH